MAVAVGGALASAACGEVLGLEEHQPFPDSSGAGGTLVVSSSSSGGSSGTLSGSGGAGAGGAVGSGGGGGSASSKVLMLEAGGFHTCALMDDATVRCWGQNNNGQLGDTTTMEQPTPVQVSGLSGVAAVRVGGKHTCARLLDGTVRCWGDNDYGQLGNGMMGPMSVAPVPVTNLQAITHLALGGSSSDGHSCAVLGDNTARCWGNNSDGQLGDSSQNDTGTPVGVANLPGIDRLALGRSHSCALLADGTLECWGQDDCGQLGDGMSDSTDFRTTPAPVMGLPAGVRVIAAAAGFEHTCAIVDGGDVYCWGDNWKGQLGNGMSGNTADSPVPVKVSNLTNATQITVGVWHSCALLAGGSVRCWGYNSSGQLGDGSDVDASIPTAVVNIADVDTITSGSQHVCALHTDGSVSCWGHNLYGQLGDSSDMESSVPVPIAF
jgi:alpha-tubulin suppressor-like RCC1 family protein